MDLLMVSVLKTQSYYKFIQYICYMSIRDIFFYSSPSDYRNWSRRKRSYRNFQKLRFSKDDKDYFDCRKKEFQKLCTLFVNDHFDSSILTDFRDGDYMTQYNAEGDPCYRVFHDEHFS